MIGLSTSWKSSLAHSGEELFAELASIEPKGLELDYRITPKILEEIIPLMKRESIGVLSIHNFCPLPDNIPQKDASANAFLLSSTDKEERQQALKYSLKTIQLAHDLEAKAVVFHIGHVDIDSKKERFFELFNRNEMNSSASRAFIDEQLNLRKKAQQKNMDAVLFSLNKLNSEGEKLNIQIGIENRYNFHEIPNSEEIGIILKEFRGGKIGYWHDIGHSEVQEKFGIVKKEELLSSYSSDLIGIHIHDLNGYDDHYAPGMGEFDFDTIKKYLNDNVIKIMEVHSKVAREDLIQGMKFLRSKGIG